MKLPEKKELTERKLSFGSLLEIESIGRITVGGGTHGCGSRTMRLLTTDEKLRQSEKLSWAINLKGCLLVTYFLWLGSTF